MPLKFAVGVNSMLVPLITTVPPTALDTAVMVSAWPASLAGPAVSLPSSEAKLMIRARCPRPRSTAVVTRHRRVVDRRHRERHAAGVGLEVVGAVGRPLSRTV